MHNKLLSLYYLMPRQPRRVFPELPLRLAYVKRTCGLTVARRQGCAAQVASEKGLFSLIFNLQGSWIVRQSVGSTPCLLGKAGYCNYIRGPKYLEIDVDIGSSTVANGVLGLVVGVITTLVVDMAFLVQANTTDELPERLIGAVRVSHMELKSAVVPKLEPEIS
ncbi:protein ENHANCED DISEASE RESISTANCE 2-like isoform X2 [Citrus sinensis]|uniref:protein ENHANCED DISEASE RESISTANCE 2-like isoform X2 n=1 Tax=Citrus sinensis TaxID=2711 RepID=UPI0022783107|nr:protein ENHANCED DISEASE RESISTANCE 2-like isoform X2 [Citrus sinensis]